MYSDSFILNILFFIIGLVGLVKGSGWFIDGASFIAHRLKIPDAIIGLTLVSIGTSLPELATNIYSASTGNPAIAMGVIPGSNITNILLVLGISIVLLKVVPVSKLLFYRDSTVMLLAFIIFVVMCYFFPDSAGNNALNRIEAAILLILFCSYMILLFKRSGTIKEEIKEECDNHSDKSFINTLPRSSFALLGGGFLVALGSQLMVDNVVWIADTKLHISPQVIAVTIVAFGTSVPELAVTFTGIIKKKSDIAIGNIIGSGIFNLVFVMGITGLIAEIPVSKEVTQLILPYMLGSAILLFIFMRTGWNLKRWEGIIFILLFLSFITLNIVKTLAPA